MSHLVGMLCFLVLLVSTPLHAQEVGDLQAGRSLAREVCAACHAVLEGQTRSPNPQAPAFERVAHAPGMTPMALTVFLQTSHRTMPNILLDAKEVRDVVAYITSLQNRP